MDLNVESITFGKYKDLTLQKMLRDRKYCKWLLEQDWFQKNYEYLFNRVKNYKPLEYLVDRTKIYDLKKEDKESNFVYSFISNYTYFNLYDVDKLSILLSENDAICYKFYLSMMNSLKNKLLQNENENPFDIKAPKSWLKLFEEITKLSRDIFKEFLVAYDLPNITSVVEDIKKMGGINYKGAKSFLIAKERSLEQEKYWSNILKKYFGDSVSEQFKYNHCIFDFINIEYKILYECKLGLKDFDNAQYKKYLTTLGNYEIVYLVDRDCIINFPERLIYTTNPEKYKIINISSKFKDILQTFLIVHLANIEDYFNS